MGVSVQAVQWLAGAEADTGGICRGEEIRRGKGCCRDELTLHKECGGAGQEPWRDPMGQANSLTADFQCGTGGRLPAGEAGGAVR